MSEPATVLADPAPQSSVEFETTAKGVICPKVKVYDVNATRALETAKRLYLEAQAFARAEGVQP